MLYREIIAVCSEIHTEHINTLCGQNIEFLMLNLVVSKVTTGLEKGYVRIVCSVEEGLLLIESIPTVRRHLYSVAVALMFTLS
jgi:hypothetical protein